MKTIVSALIAIGIVAGSTASATDLLVTPKVTATYQGAEVETGTKLKTSTVKVRMGLKELITLVNRFNDTQFSNKARLYAVVDDESVEFVIREGNASVYVPMTFNGISSVYDSVADLQTDAWSQKARELAAAGLVLAGQIGFDLTGMNLVQESMSKAKNGKRTYKYSGSFSGVGEGSIMVQDEMVDALFEGKLTAKGSSEVID